MRRRHWVVVGRTACALLCGVILACGGEADRDKTPGSGGAMAAGAGGSAEQGGDAQRGGGAGRVGNAGSAGSANEGGHGSAEGGATSNWYVSEVRQGGIDKVDLLLMIDNSAGMVQKQQLLAEAVPRLLRYFVTPPCVDEAGAMLDFSDENGACAAGRLRFPPLKDIHVGVVSSSLGAHGGTGVCTKPTDNDAGQLVPAVRRDPAFPIATWNDSGFLVWDPDSERPTHDPPGESDLMDFSDHVTNMVDAVGSSGCGFEATLEAWYRFLIDPSPPLSIPAVTDVTGMTQPSYSSDPATNPILEQRASFLRPDSLVGIIMFSDENDCSIKDAGQGWLVGTTALNGNSFHMPRATSVCDTNPNDPCCGSCASTLPGCPASASDPACHQGAFYGADEDNLNLRCFEQKRRFGVDFLYPTQRYVDGLTQLQVPDPSGVMVENPLFAGRPRRDPGLVFLAGIVGVPWQDIADPDTLPPGVPLRFLPYQQLVESGRWEMILGDDDGKAAPRPPMDKLMVETTADRSSLWPNTEHPVIGAAGRLAPATAVGQPNVINGHESKIEHGEELQYACIFPLPEAIDCSDPDNVSCDCRAEDAAVNRAVCNGTTQTHAKAHPSLRQLRVLKDFGATGAENSIVASICPKTLKSGDPAYGYQPAMDAIGWQMGNGAMRQLCMPRALDVETDPASDEYGQVPCVIAETTAANERGCSCADEPGRRPLDAAAAQTVRRQLKQSGACGNAGQPSCDDVCLCEIEQLSGAALTSCLSESATPSDIFGFCYVDPSLIDDADLRQSAEELVAACPATQKRMLRFMGEDLPANGSRVWLACGGP